MNNSFPMEMQSVFVSLPYRGFCSLVTDKRYVKFMCQNRKNSVDKTQNLYGWKYILRHILQRNITGFCPNLTPWSLKVRHNVYFLQKITVIDDSKLFSRRRQKSFVSLNLICQALVILLCISSTTFYSVQGKIM